jgi:hypothetical protein
VKKNIFIIAILLITVKSHTHNKESISHSYLISQSVSIGDKFQGGIVAYILQSDDPGYVEGETHGLIAAPFDQSMDAEWGCYGTEIPGSDGSHVGSGNRNTLDIIKTCSATRIAARICTDLSLNGYSDWYLPSKDELDKLYINKDIIGGLDISYYWSSTELNRTSAWLHCFGNGNQYDNYKNVAGGVRAVRTF